MQSVMVVEKSFANFCYMSSVFLTFVQDCFHETHDWRKCQKQMKEFRECMANQDKKAT